jgi:hypothetical protein
MKVIADRDPGHAEPANQVMVNEILRRGLGPALVEGQHDRAVEPCSGQKPQLGGLVRQPKLRAVRAEEAPRMRLECESQGGAAIGAAHLDRGIDHGAMAEMNAVEIAHCHNGSPRNRGVRRGIADNREGRHLF